MKLFLSFPRFLLCLPLLSCPQSSKADLLRGGEAQEAFAQPLVIAPFGVPASGGQLLQASGSSAPTGPSPSQPQSTECKCIDVADNTCSVSKVAVRQDHTAAAGISLADVSAIWGSDTLSHEQRQKVVLAKVSETSFQCLDDRVAEASIYTPGGDLGEFILALSSYLQERDPTGNVRPSQEVVNALLLKYLETIPTSRPLIHCTDDRAISHLEAEMPLENLDLRSPPDHAKESLLKKLTEVENHGDSHIRMLLKKPEWFQLSEFLVPMAVTSFYTLLWQQSSDPRSPLNRAPKLKLEVLVGQADPVGFLEVSSGELCHSGGVAPMLTARTPQRSILISHLDAVSLRREELATFFARIANASPRKINRDQLHQRLDRHGWLALETTGSRVAAGLPFYTLTYS
mmetsp:Transcript_126597/g.200745  ORF Transcript_126597/g.200745 Transcript_126597/m.200745 type:complete len:401 (+) Transcript_126597:81-1283(+)